MKHNSEIDEINEKEGNRIGPSARHSSELSFNHLSKMLLSLNLISSELTNEHKICLEFPSIDIDLKKSEDMGGSSSINNNTLSITSSLCSYDIKINYLFKVYKSLNYKELYSFEDFRVLIQIFASIFSAFNDTLFKYDLSKDLITEQFPCLQLYSIEDNEANQTFKERIDSMYAFVSEIKNDFYDKNLLFFLSVLSLFGDIAYHNFTHDTITRNIEVYNSIYISDFKLFLLIHFHLVILLNITIKKLSIDKFLTTPNKKKKEARHSSSVCIPTLYFIDNYSNEHSLEESFKLISMTSMIKHYLLPYFESSGLICNVNLTILSYEALRWISTNFQLESNLNQFAYNKEMLLTSKQFVDLVNDYDINGFNIILDHSFSFSAISSILSPYMDIIVNARLFNAETEKIAKDLMLQYEDYIAELDMVLEVLKLNLKIKKAKNKKKSLSVNYSFHFGFNSFDITVKKDLSIKDKHIRSIIVFFNQKHFNEEDLVNHISKRGGIGLFYHEFRKIMSEFQYYKKYSIGIRISQNKIINEQLQYFFSIIYLQIQHYLLEHFHSHKNVILYETEFISPQMTIIISNTIKQKEKLSHYYKFIKKFELVFISVLNQYINTLIDCFDEIVIHYEPNEKKYLFDPRILRRNFNENILIIITDAVCIDIIVYMHENEYSKEYHEKIMNWIQLIRLNPDIADIIKGITVVINKQCLAEMDYHNTDAHLKRFLFDVNTLYLIDKEYDLILQDRKIVIYNRDIDSEHNQLETFINIVRNCYDTIQYVETNQLREYNNFGFVCNKNKYLFQFKAGCLSIRKITAKGFTSLFVLDPFKSNNSYPLVNGMTDKSRNDFSFNNLVRLFKKYYLKLEDVSQSNVIDILQNEILNSIYGDITIILLKIKYYDIVKAMLPKAMFGNIIVYPIKLNKVELTFNEAPICREITMFQFENTKLNFYSKSHMGKMFSIGKTEKTLSNLKSNASSYSKSIRRLKIDHLMTIIWVFDQKIKNKRYNERIMKNISPFLIDRKQYLNEGIVNRYLVDFNIVANEIRKYKKKGRKSNEDNKSDLNKNDNTYQTIDHKRKGSDILQDNNNTIKNDANIEFRQKSHSLKLLHKNCTIF